jgi:hypothetical protein
MLYKIPTRTHSALNYYRHYIAFVFSVANARRKSLGGCVLLTFRRQCCISLQHAATTMEVTDDNIWEILGLHRGDDEFSSGDFFEAGDVLKEGHPPSTFDDTVAHAGAPTSSPVKPVTHSEDETVTLVEAELAKAQSLLSRVSRDRRGRNTGMQLLSNDQAMTLFIP